MITNDASPAEEATVESQFRGIPFASQKGVGARRVALPNLCFVRRFTSPSSDQAEQPRRRCIGQPDHALCKLPQNAAPLSFYCLMTRSSLRTWHGCCPRVRASYCPFSTRWNSSFLLLNNLNSSSRSKRCGRFPHPQKAIEDATVHVNQRPNVHPTANLVSE
jgi:hypothetical protein